MSSLSNYRKKRSFKKTSEPKGSSKKISKKEPIFVIQKHNATRLHYDFRIQIKGSLRSWAVPKGIPISMGVKRLAILTENHPLEYAKFEGVIPKGEYGAGTVEIWDSGTFENLKKDKNGKEIDISKCFKNGQIEFFLKGKKLNGPYALIRFKDEKSWLLLKMKKKT